MSPKTENNGKKIANKMIKSIFKMPLKILISVFAPIILFIVLITIIWYSVEDLVSIDVSTATSGQIAKSTSIAGDGSIEIDDNIYSEIRKSLIDVGIDPETYWLGEDDYVEGTDITYLEKMVQAEIVSSYLDTGVGDIKGIVKIKRNGTDLKYKNYTEFQNILNEAQNNSEYFNTDGNLNYVKNIFTLDDELNIIVITVSKNTKTASDGTETVTYTVKPETLNYKQVVAPFSMPFEFLFTLMQVTKNPEFVAAVADLALENSEIVLNVYDSESKTTITTKTSWDEVVYSEEKTEKLKQDTEENNTQNGALSSIIQGAIVGTDATGQVEKEENKNQNPSIGPITPEQGMEEKSREGKSETEEEIITTNTISFKLTKADTWIYDKIANYEKKPDNPDPITSKNKEETEKGEITTSTSEEKDENGEVISFTFKRTRTDIENKVIEITTEIESTTWQESAENKKEEINVDKFLGLWKNDTGQYVKGSLYNKNGKVVYYNVPNESAQKSPVQYIVNSSSLFFEFLSNSENTQNIELLMKYILYVYTGNDYGVTDTKELLELFKLKPLNTAGTVSPFGCTMTKEEFVAAVQRYNGGSGYYNLLNAAGDFYDICTSEEYNVNPCLAFAWAAYETGYGENIPNNNLFGMAVYNGANSGSVYESYADSIKDFCEWVVYAATPGTKKYEEVYARAQEFFSENSKFGGTPANNIYVLFSKYMYLGDTHLCDELDFNNPKGVEWYKANGSNWGSGGRIYIYYMYEIGGLYTNEYASRCGHTKASDPTTIAEKADYVQWSIEKRIAIAKSIFGNGCFNGEFNSLVDVAYMVADHFRNSGVEVHYAAASNPDLKSNGRHVIDKNIREMWDKPLTNPEYYGIVCATYVTLVIWQAGYIDEDTINKYDYNNTHGVQDMLENSEYAKDWMQIKNFNELEDGDIVLDTDHIYIYINEGKRLDQQYCVVSSAGSKDFVGKLQEASPKNFVKGYRYTK